MSLLPSLVLLPLQPPLMSMPQQLHLTCLHCIYSRTPATAKKARGCKGKKAPATDMTPQQVHEATEETVGTHYHSQATITNYEGRIKNFKQYIANTRPELVSCLEKGGVNENTPIACKHYLANEMEKKQLLFSTADGVHSALKGWFYHAHDCYNGKYHLVAESRQKW
ncbi:hypothetical protein DFS34DRAFT_662120 [Phlyctochytrium arcticum]|nr:hypothetical protein DFS34DRAFT_662120 [Phlyctochytrium arcticum]